MRTYQEQHQAARRTSVQQQAAANRRTAAGSAREIVRLQQQIGNRATGRFLQAQLDEAGGGGGAANVPAAAVLRVERFEIETFEQLYYFSVLRGETLRQEMEELPRDLPLRAEAEELVNAIRFWQPAMRQRGQERLTPAVVSQAELYFEEWTRLMAEIRRYKRAQIEWELGRAISSMREAERRLAAERERLRRQLRPAFLSGNEDRLAQIASFIGNVTDIGLGLRELSQDMARAISDAAGGAIPPASRYVRWLDRFNRILAAANTLYSAANIRAPTELGTAVNQINTLTGAFSAGGTLLGLSAHIGLYTNLYLAPLTQAILANLNVILTNYIHEQNVVAAAAGFSVDARIEPGGEPMYRFMLEVMRARVPGDIPPVPEAVEDYMLDFRDLISAGAGSELPTTGFWFWRDLDTDQISSWIFFNRETLWAMFYGEMQVPQQRRR